MTNDRTKNASRNIIWGIVNRLIALGLPFANRTVLVYVLGATYLGLDSLFLSILQMLNITELGFSSAIVFSMYKPIAEENYVEINALLRLYQRVYRIIGVIVLCIGTIIIPVFPHIIKSDLPKEINIYILYIIYLANTFLGYWLFAYKKSLISAFQREDILSNINSIVSITKIVLQIILLFLSRSYYLYIVVLPFITIIENLIVADLAGKLFPKCFPQGNVDNVIKNDIKKRVYGLMIQKICSVSRNSLDSIVISAYAGLKDVSMYGNYYYIMTGLHSLLGTITNSITASVGNSVATNSAEKNHYDMIKFSFVYMWLASDITIYLLCVFQPFMLLWMGENMLLDIPIVIALCIYFYALCMGDIRSVYVVASGLWYEGRYRAVLEALTNLVLNIVLGKYFGIMGVVVATLISILVINFGYGSTIIYTYYFKNKKLHVYYLYQLYFAIVTCIAGGLCYRLCEFCKGQGIMKIIANIVICTVVSNGILFCAYCKLPVYKEAKDMGRNVVKRFRK